MSHLQRNETVYQISIKFCLTVRTPDVITYANFGDDRLRGLGVAGVKFPHSPQAYVVVLTHVSIGYYCAHCDGMMCNMMMMCIVRGRAGASPNRRDYGRRLCAEEWARFCGRHSCADAIAKYIRSTKYFFTKTFLLAKDKWKSEPDLVQLAGPAARSTGSAGGAGQQKAAVTRRDSGGWIQRHLSLKRKKQQQPPPPQVSSMHTVVKQLRSPCSSSVIPSTTSY